MKACEDFLNQMYVNKMEDKYFADNMVIYIKKMKILIMIQLYELKNMKKR